MSESPSRIEYLRGRIEASKRAFATTSADTGYIFSRGLTSSIGTDQTYENYLPSFNSVRIVETIGEKVKERLQHPSNSGEKVRYLDIGYGNGQALLEAKKTWGDGIQPIGYGTTNHSRVSYKKNNINYPPTYDDLIANKIELVDGNVLDINHHIPADSVDVVSALHSLDYTKLPYWEVIKKIYKVLKPGGIAFLSNIYIANYVELQDYLTREGYEFEIGFDEISFKKTKSLNLSVRTKTGEVNELQTVEVFSNS